MDFTSKFLLLICGFSVINSLFLGLYLFLNQRIKKNEANQILGMIFFLISFKVAYPVFFSSNEAIDEIHAWYYRWILACWYLIGPLVFFYVKALVAEFFHFKRKHLFFIIPFVFIVAFPVHTIPHFTYRFLIIQFWMLIFLILSAHSTIRFHNSKQGFGKKHVLIWQVSVIFGVFIIWFTAMTQHFVEMLAFFCFLIASMIYILMEKRYIIYHDYPIKENIGVSQQIKHDQKTDIVEKLNEVMQTEKLYLNNELTLPKLAEKMNVSLHVLSKVINEALNKGFSDYVNHYRIEEAKKKLNTAKANQQSIPQIAASCGFNSLSTFNRTFKKLTSKTPSQYRKENTASIETKKQPTNCT